MELDLSLFEGHTPGPWEYDDGGFSVTRENEDGTTKLVCEVTEGDEHDDADGRLIAAAPALLAEVRRLREEREALAEALEDLWHAEVWTDTYCQFCEAHAPTCDAGPIGPIPHGEDCARAAVEAALARVGRPS